MIGREHERGSQVTIEQALGVLRTKEARKNSHSCRGSTDLPPPFRLPSCAYRPRSLLLCVLMLRVRRGDVGRFSADALGYGGGGWLQLTIFLPIFIIVRFDLLW